MVIQDRFLYTILFLLIYLPGCTENRDEANYAFNEQTSVMEKSVTLINNEEEKRVDIWIHGKLFTSYLYGDTFKKPVLYPINTAGGVPVTRGFPLDPRPGEAEDHPHQAGHWLNYGDVNGLDFWNHSNAVPEERKEFYGTIVHKEITRISSGDEQGELEVVMEWVGPDGEILLVENTRFVFSGNGNHEEDSGRQTGKRIIDRTTRLTAPDSDISLKDNKEGMFGLRMARELEHPDEHEDASGIYRSSEGLIGHDVWGTRARWVNLTGKIGNDDISVAIFDHPDNVGYPTYWHARGYGLFSANPLGMKEMSGGKEELNYSLSAGDSVEFKYRIVIWSGEEISDEHVDRNWKEWAMVE